VRRHFHSDGYLNGFIGTGVTSHSNVIALSRGEDLMDKSMKNKTAILLFLLPACILFIGIIVVPILMSAYYSLLDWDGITKSTFVGFDNYIQMFTKRTIGFPDSVKNSFLLAGLSVFIQLPISLGLALVLARGIKGEKIYTAIFFVPVIIATTVIGQLWLKIYNPEYGIINTALRAMGLDSLAMTWLGDEKTALIAVFIPILWQYVGYHMLLMYTGIKSQPTELREAAMIDGANEWQTARYVTIPLLKPVLKVCVIFAITGSLKAFDLIYVLTNGGPAHASEVPTTIMIKQLFSRNNYGVGSAIAVFIVFICFFFAILIKKAFKTEVDE